MKPWTTQPCANERALMRAGVTGGEHPVVEAVQRHTPPLALDADHVTRRSSDTVAA